MALRSVMTTLGLLLIVGVGCGEKFAATYEVTGKVTGGTGDVSGIQIMLVASEGTQPGATGVVQADGTYKLTTTQGRSGAELGKYKVVLSLGPERMQKAMSSMQGTMKPGAMMKGPPKFQMPFPETWLKPETSPKEVEVKASANVVDITI